MIFEVCTDQIDHAVLAEQHGAHRIELCADLEAGGTTPSYGVIHETSQRCNIPIYVMIRPRGGDFVYSPKEVEAMATDIHFAAQAGAKGVVFGALNSTGWIDVPTTLNLLQVARKNGLHVTFHRAFDLCPSPLEALRLFIELQIDNVLTSGQKPTAHRGIQQIANFVQEFGGDINLIAGSGVNPENAKEIAKSGVHAIHFTCRKPSGSGDAFSFGHNWIFDTEKIESIVGIG